MNLALLGLLVLQPTLAPDRIAYGEVWIIANCWGAYLAVLAGTSRDGLFNEREIASFPPYWKQAFDYRLLIGGSDQSIPPSEGTETERGYGTGDPECLLQKVSFHLLVSRV
jgi:hypothetical protein